MNYLNYNERTTSWHGLYEGIAVLDSIKKYGFVIRQIEIKSGIYECYFPHPEENEYCIHITNISRDRIIAILEEYEDFDLFLEEKNLTISDLEGGVSIIAILMYLDDFFRIMDFFDLHKDEDTLISKTHVKNLVLKSFSKVKKSHHSFIDDLLNKRGYYSCPEYLWKIKVTDEEYQELKDYIAKKLRDNAASDLYEREVALLFAEFHRREYDYSDIGPTTLVYNSLGIQDEKLIDIRTFGNIASQGAERLGIQLYANDRATLYVYSLFYHGGLPLQKLSLRPSDPSWHRLIRYLLESDEPVDFNNFEDLVTGVTANHIDALKAFCQELQNAILTNDYLALPFFCTSEEDPRYQMFLNIGQRAIAEIRNKNPFRLGWSFEVDMPRRIIRPKYKITGPDSIPFDSEFLIENNLQDRDSFTISSFEEGKELLGVVYKKYQNQNDFYGDRPFEIGLEYRDNSNVSVRLDNEILLSEELDIDSPQIISINEDGDYEITRNKFIGHKEILVIVPEGWNIENEENYYVEEDYDYLGSTARIIILRKGIENQSVVLTDVGGSRKIISATVPLSKVIVMNKAVTNHLRESAFYDVKNLVYYIKRSDGSLRRISREDLRFCSDRRTGRWLEKPPLGYIYVKSVNDAAHADPLKILNLGDVRNSLHVLYPQTCANSCNISVEWDNGVVVCPNGVRKNGAWHFVKDNLEDSRYVTFVFTPDHQAGNSFSLSVKTRFSDFQLFDEEGQTVQRYGYISLADLPRYYYHIQDITFNLNVRIGDEDIVNDRDKNYTYLINAADNNGERVVVTVRDEINNRIISERTILRESSLDTLFGSMELLKKQINSFPGDMRNTSIIVSATVNNRPINFQIQKYPYRFYKNPQNELEIKKRTGRPAPYNGMVMALPFYRYEEIIPQELYQNEAGNYVIPEIVREWGDVLLFSGKGEWVLPHSIDCIINGERSKEESAAIYREKYLPMKDTEYPNATIWNNTWQRGCYWFAKAYKEHIPASSLFDLQAILSSSKLMARFVFNMLLRGLKEGSFADYKVWLKRALLDMSDDNSFLWIWVHEEDYTFNYLGIENVDIEELKGFLQGWYLYKQDYEKLQYLFDGKSTNDDTQGFVIDFFSF